MAEKIINQAESALLFESSWEVCNRVGGIYTVLSTHAKQLSAVWGDRLVFVGPDIEAIYPESGPNPLFSPEPTPFDEWASLVNDENPCAVGAVRSLNLRCGRWNIPGRPLAILVDFRPYYEETHRIFADLWTWYGVDSLKAAGDYPEACTFAWACGEAIRSLSDFLTRRSMDGHDAPKRVVAHFHEWTTGAGLLYVKHFMPQAATVFTTHATSIGRSICGNGKQLYAYLSGYHGDQMARELNMEAKHSLEKTAAHQADCFTTVSDITARECAQLLDKAPDVVTPNGFEDDFVLPAAAARKQRAAARARLLDVASATLGCELPENTVLIGTGGRYEYRNKGLDAFIGTLRRLADRLEAQAAQHPQTERPSVLAYILVPGNVSAPRQEVLDNLRRPPSARQRVYHPYNTHWMNYIEDDQVINYLKSTFANRPEDPVKVIFVPCYLHGRDGIFNTLYYDLLQGFDLTAFLSYYEPWGYTPLESVAFSIPTLTTCLSGFGDWFKCLSDKTDRAASPADCLDIRRGVAVVERNDGNYLDMVEQAADVCLDFIRLSPEERRQAAEAACRVSRQALWKKFIPYYHESYRLALERAAARCGIPTSELRAEEPTKAVKTGKATKTAKTTKTGKAIQATTLQKNTAKPRQA